MSAEKEDNDSLLSGGERQSKKPDIPKVGGRTKSCDEEINTAVLASQSIAHVNDLPSARALILTMFMNLLMPNRI